MLVYCAKCGKERPEIYRVCLKCGSSEVGSPLSSPPPLLTPCPECGGERSQAELRGAALGSIWLYLAQPGRRDTFESTKTSAIKVLVCNSCGYTALYATSPLNLLTKRPDKPVEDTGEQ